MEIVDLGLSVKWGKCNLGAATETDFGDYFAWGETEPYYQDGYAVDENALWKPGKEYGYDWNSYRWIDGNDLLKYCPDVTGAPDLTVLAPEDDAATAILGEGWRIPTPEEIDELLDPDFCTMAPEAIETSNGTSVIGVRFTGIKTRESIFIPFAGHRRSITFFADLEGGIWTSSVAQGDPEDYKNAIRLAFYGADEPDSDTFLRWFGLPIRPVWTK